jgi:hypothetical protein
VDIARLTGAGLITYPPPLILTTGSIDTKDRKAAGGVIDIDDNRTTGIGDTNLPIMDTGLIDTDPNKTPGPVVLALIKAAVGDKLTSPPDSTVGLMVTTEAAAAGEVIEREDN